MGLDVDQVPALSQSITLLAVVCDAGNKADIFGRASIDGAGSHSFKISVTDNREPEMTDTYRILLDSGYDSGEHKLGGGNIRVESP